MALTITLGEHDDFYVGHRQFCLVELFIDEGFMIEDVQSGDTYEIGPEKAVEICQTVLISEGHRVLSNRTRAVFQAPENIRIYRGDLYRERGMGNADAA